MTDEDRHEIEVAVARAKENRTDIDPGLFDFIADVLMLRQRGALESEFLLRFQQFTSPVMAKGVEDTVFYCFNRMIGLNEVGGAPRESRTDDRRIPRILREDAVDVSAHHEHALHARYQAF